MSSNPYQSPQSDFQAAGVLSGRPEDLRDIARRQKGVLVCLLLQVGLYIASRIVPSDHMPMAVVLPLAGLSIATWLAGAVFVFLLSMKLYGAGVGVLLGILALIPCLGLIVLVMVNGKANKVLRDNSIHVGLMGANLAEVAAATSRR